MPGVVTVALKHPTGVHLDLYRMEQAFEPVMGGGVREIKQAKFSRRVATLNGTRRREDHPAVWHGWGITHNVDADGWDEWKKQNADSDLVKNNLIFAFPRQAETEAEVRKREKLRSGLEEADPTSLPPELRKVSTAARPS